MKPTIIKKSLIGAAVCVSALLLMTQVGVSADKNTTAATNNKSVTSLNPAGKALTIQDFKEGALSIQFRYVQDTLQAIRFMNTGDKPLKLSILSNTYVLGKGDTVVIDPPKLTYLHVYHEPIDEKSHLFGGALKTPVGKTATYKLPSKQQ